MSLERVEVCCACPEHQKPYRNEDGWILTGTVSDPETWEAWTRVEWKRHCDRYNTEKRAARKRNEHARYLRKRDAA